MDKKTVFVKTDKGESEAQGSTDTLFGDSKRIFNLVDDESTVAEITKRAPPSLRTALEGVLQELVDGGFIRDMREPVKATEPARPAIKMATPGFKMATPKAPAPPPPPPSAPVKPAPASTGRPGASPAFSMPDMSAPKSAPAPAASTGRVDSAPAGGGGDLDFSFIMSSDSAQPVAPSPVAAKSDQQAAAQAKAAAEEAAKEAKRKAYEAAKIKAQIEVAARAKIEAETRAKQEAEAARLKAEQAALKARAESDMAKARIEAEVRARLEAETKIKQEAEAIRKRAEAEAERLRKELEEARIKAEIELRNRLEAEARAKAEHEARLKREAEAERLRLEKQRAELEAARIKAEAELRMREEAEARVKSALEARLKVEAQNRIAEENRVKDELQRQMAANGAQGKQDKDPGEKLRQSFAQVAGNANNAKNANTGSFKLEAFSLVNTGKIPVLGGDAVKPPPLPGAGSKVKAALEERARKKAEEERLKAEQEAAKFQQEQAETARAKAQQEEAQAKARADAEAARSRAEQEAYRLRGEQEEAQVKLASEQQQLAQQQSRQWEEAQQRAAALAQAEKERLENEAAAAKAQKKAEKRAARGPRKRLPVWKISASLFVLAILAAVGLPYVLPTAEYLAPLEAEMSAQIRQPVKISQLEFALLPLPQLRLHGVKIGGAEQMQAGEIEMNFSVSALFAPAKAIRELNFRNLSLAGASVDKTLGWMRFAGALEQYPVARMNFTNLQIAAPAVKLPALNGRAEFDVFGRFTLASLKSQDEKIALEMKPQPGGVMLEFNMRDGILPVFPQLKFDDVSFNIAAMTDEFVISDFFAHIHGGTVTGKGRLGYSNAWTLQGLINARNIDVQHMLPGSVIHGELAGEANISMTNAALAQLGKAPRIEGFFDIKNGEFKKIDIENIARSGVRPGVAGHTNFSELSGTINAGRGEQHLVISKITTRNTRISAVIDVDEAQQLSGKLQVDIKAALGAASVPMNLSGTISDPVLQPGR